MNTNIRALVFGSAIAAAMVLTLDTVTAAERVEAVTTESASAVAAAADVAVIRLDTIYVTARKDQAAK